MKSEKVPKSDARKNIRQPRDTRLLLGLLIPMILAFGCSGIHPPASGSRSPGLHRVLRLEPGPGNPRNSEGDFIQLRDGRVLFVYTHFTGGDADHAAAHLTARESRDGGQTWTANDTLVVANEGGMNVMSVSLVRLKSGPIALFYLRKNSTKDCRPVVRFSRDEARTWSEPVECINDEIGYYVLNNARVLQLAGGRLVMPVAQHTHRDGVWQPGEVICYLSDDEGKTWRRGPARLTATAEGKPVDLMEPGLVETTPNRLLMVIRTRVGCQYFARSVDGGDRWSEPEPSPILSPESPATLTKFPGGGTLVMIWNDHRGRPLEYRSANPPHRTPLVLALSRDGGRTWERTKIIENVSDAGYCYTAARWIGQRLLLGYCAHRSPWGLATTQVTLLDRRWIEG
jgi:sialidase-1